MTTTADGRFVPPPRAGERAMLESWLDFHRDTLAFKCAGLDDGQVRTPSTGPSPMTLLGLVQHLAVVERNWFQRVFAGQPAPRGHGEDHVGGFVLSPDHGIDEALARWREEIARGRELTAGSSLDDCGRISEEEAVRLGSRDLSLRWILLHLIGEYARHNGHADLIRERIDGATGV